jgi:hypothetical protein
MNWLHPWLGVIAAIVLAISLSTTQSLICARVGSDHAVHMFLTDGIRRNRHRLFVTIPRLLNICHCAALPLYIHWAVSYFRGSTIYWSERLLNPVTNALHVAVFAALASIAARLEGLTATWVALATCAFALTPQFYHALSARNFGLSARGTGLLLLTLFLLAAYGVESGADPLLCWVALALLGWLVWGFSTFTTQALCIISTLLLITTGRWVPLTGTLLGLSLFIAIHPRYSLSYLRHTLRFIRTYATELAPVYILSRRKSIWRDLAWDIWLRARSGVQAGFRYAYENSLLVVLLLNPLLLPASAAALRDTHSSGGGFIAYSSSIALAGAIAVVLTSFRPTRFLGEPERYAEAVTPWAVVSGAFILQAVGGIAPLVGLVLVFLLADLLQLLASRMLLKHVSENDVGLADVEAVLAKPVGGSVRFSSNNEHFTKMLMKNSWQFAYCMAAGQDYAGLKMQEIFSTFPMVRREACERIVSTYRVNFCLLDRKLYDTLFDQLPPALRSISTVYESARFRLLILDWADAPPASLKAA